MNLRRKISSSEINTIRSEEAKFWQKVNKDTGSECWYWTDYVGTSSKGYGVFYYRYDKKRRKVSAHFASWIISKRENPPLNMFLDHQCHNDSDCNAGIFCLHRKCVNPNHLKLSTPQDNVLNDKTFAAKQKAKTHCPKGHLHTPDNNIAIKARQGLRSCLICSKQHDIDRKEAINEARALLGLGYTEYTKTYGRSRSTALEIIKAHQ